MQPAIRLFDEQWQKIGPHYWRGYAWLNGQSWTPSAYQGEPLEHLAGQLNGCFSWITTATDSKEICIINDQLGSVQLFYGRDYITDRPSALGLDVDTSWLEEKHWTNVEALPGRCTIYKDCSAVLSGEYLSWNKELGWQRQFYEIAPYKTAGQAEDFKKLVLETAQRLIDYAKGRKIIVLLSDGYDSRLVLAALVALKCPNLAAVTYGIEGNGVVARGREIANRLEVPFTFVNYADPEHEAVMTRDYPLLTERYSNGQLIVQEQEIFAVAKLKRMLGEDAILVPGISGDLQGGSYVPPYWFRWKGNRTDRSLRYWLQSRLTRYPQQSKAAERWRQTIQLPTLPDSSELSAVRATEQVITQERVSKYICSTLRVYEFYGFDWYLPQWDAAFIQFWHAQSVENRRFRKMYRKWCKEQFFIPAGIHFEGEGEQPKVHLGRIIRRFLPFGNKIAAGVPDPNQLAPALEKLLGEKIGETEVNAALGNYLVAYYKAQQ